MGKDKLIWIPRILTITYIIFLSLFSLDVFTGDDPLFSMIGGFLVHNIPGFIMIIILVFSWKRPFIGGFIFCLWGLLSILLFRTYDDLFSLFFISLIPVITGGLYLLFSSRIHG